MNGVKPDEQLKRSENTPVVCLMLGGEEKEHAPEHLEKFVFN